VVRKLYTPTVVKLSDEPIYWHRHRNGKTVPHFRGANIRYIKAEINRVRRGRDQWGRRIEKEAAE
jgi:hypothetical protein